MQKLQCRRTKCLNFEILRTLLVVFRLKVKLKKITETEEGKARNDIRETNFANPIRI